MSDTAIEWTEKVWNPTTGCDQVSPGCDNCYALAMAARLKAMGQAKYQRNGDPRTSGPGFRLTVHPTVVNQPLRWRAPKRVFVNSMSDLFHADVPSQWLVDIFAVMAAARRHTFQVLTKRHGRMRSLLNDSWFIEQVRVDSRGKGLPATDWTWPLPNLWLGVSAEDQPRAEIRLGALEETPAAVRWMSAEPLLGHVDASPYMGFLGWVVSGGESGPSARPTDLDWHRSLRDQCGAAGVPYLFKQVGGRTSKSGGRLLDGRTHDEYPAGGRAATAV